MKLLPRNILPDNPFEMGDIVRFKMPSHLDLHQKKYAGKKAVIEAVEPCYKDWHYIVRILNTRTQVGVYTKRIERIES